MEQIKENLMRLPILISCFLLVASLPVSTGANAIWLQMGQDLEGDMTDDGCGSSIALTSDGNRLAVGSPGDAGGKGCVRVYDWNGSSWQQTGSDIVGEATTDHSGSAVALSPDGSRLAVGAPFNAGNGENSGQVRIYEWRDFSWIQIGTDIDGEAAGDLSGSAVALSNSGYSVAVGAYANTAHGLNSGHVRVKNLVSNEWTIKGADIDGDSRDRFGYAVALNSRGDRLVAGAPGKSGYGCVRIYDWTSSGNYWYQVGQEIDGFSSSDHFGSSIDLSPDGYLIAIGSGGADRARVYAWYGSIWYQQGSAIVGDPADNAYGVSVAVADSWRVAIGAPVSDSGIYPGRVRVYERNDNAWQLIGQIISGKNPGDRMGWSVALSSDGSRLAVGIPGDSGGKGCVRVFDYHQIVYELLLNSEMFRSQDRFTLWWKAHNPGPDVTLQHWIILEISGHFWFAPGWTPETDFEMITLSGFSQGYGVLLDFTWPEGDLGSAYGLRFWGAFLDESFNLAGNYGMVEFGYE